MRLTRLTILLLTMTGLMWGQTVMDLATPVVIPPPPPVPPPALRCVVTFSPATAATDIAIDCSINGVAVSTTKVKIASIVGNANGFAQAFINGPSATITIIMKRLLATGPVNISATVNGGTAQTKDVVVP